MRRVSYRRLCIAYMVAVLACLPTATIILLAVEYGRSQSYWPTPGSWDDNRVGQYPSATTNHGGAEYHGDAQALPTAATHPSAPQPQGETSETKRERAEHAANERGLTVYTAWLAVFTGLLFIVAMVQACFFFWQLRLMHEGVQDAKDAANGAQATAAATADVAAAAKASAEVAQRGLTLAHQPYIMIKDVYFNTLSSARGAAPPSAKYTAQVYGRTPAMLRYASEELIFGTHIPLTPTFGAGWRRIDFVKESGDKWESNVAYTGDAADDELRGTAASARGKRFFLVGRILYDDIFGQEHEAGFCYQTGIGGGYGLIHGGVAYNYHRAHERQNP